VEIFTNLNAFIWQDYHENNCNTYFIDGEKGILIDPGHQHLIEHVERGLYTIQKTLDDINVVIITHGHPDHMESIGRFKKPTLWGMNEKEFQFIRKLAGSHIKIPEPDFFLDTGQLLIGDQQFNVLVTPGHSPASICLYWPAKKALFTGDVIFFQGIGRTDLPGGDGSLLKRSIMELSELDVEYVLPGHGEIISGKKAVQKNFKGIMEYWFNYI
jgi:glyoxylase-like metal-dependent hydrolase (beta-lactamase superfamily II)